MENGAGARLQLAWHTVIIEEYAVIDMLARKSQSGQLCINKARMHLARHEWGLARIALEDGLSKGGLHDHTEVEELLRDILGRLHHGLQADPKPGSSAAA